MKYIDSEKLIAEIERYKQGAAIARFDNAGENADYFQDKVDLCDDLTHIITSLQQEQPEADFEKELNIIWFDNKFGNRFGNSTVDFANVREICRHFFELGMLNARKEK